MCGQDKDAGGWQGRRCRMENTGEEGGLLGCVNEVKGHRLWGGGLMEEYKSR